MLQRTPEEKDRAKHRVNMMILVIDLLLILYLIIMVLLHWFPEIIEVFPFLELIRKAA